MHNHWNDAAESLKKAIQDRAVAEFLGNHSAAEVAVTAGNAFQTLGEKEQASVIATLATQLQGKAELHPIG